MFNNVHVPADNALTIYVYLSAMMSQTQFRCQYLKKGSAYLLLLGA